MFKRLAPTFLGFALAAFALQSVGAQTPVPTPKAADFSKAVPRAFSGSRRITAIKIAEPIKIDGRFDETAWSQAEPANDFFQQQPNEGVPASEKTAVRVLFDDKNLYIGIRAFDSDAGHINARELVRDASFSNDDTTAILLDTYHDRRTLFVLRSTHSAHSRTRSSLMRGGTSTSPGMAPGSRRVGLMTRVTQSRSKFR